MQFIKPYIYYAHCMATYSSNLEKDDVNLLESMGFRVDNPNTQKHLSVVNSMKASGKNRSQIMDYFCNIVKKHDFLAFRSLRDGSVTAGVWKEVQTMREKNGVIIELPNLTFRKVLNVKQTVRYLKTGELPNE